VHYLDAFAGTNDLRALECGIANMSRHDGHLTITAPVKRDVTMSKSGGRHNRSGFARDATRVAGRDAEKNIRRLMASFICEFSVSMTSRLIPMSDHDRIRRVITYHFLLE
jgi:hypothetical protein